MNSFESLVEGVTPAQRQAIEHMHGPLLVLAGAGSGKTLVITRRLAHLVFQGVPPEAILAVTFTNKAAREMKDRVLGHVSAPGLWIHTFHAFAARVLRQEIPALGFPRSFTIYDEADRNALITAVMKELNIDTSFVPPAAVASAISRLKNDLVTPRDYEQRAAGHHAEQIARVFVRYEHSLKLAGALDFDDLLLKLRELLVEHPEVQERWCRKFHYLLVDEYQDTNLVQYELVKQLGHGHRNVCVTGDPDQAIYTWRGADIRNILSFEKDFPEAQVIKLEKNFRSVGNILKAADAVIANNRERKPKTLFTDAPDGGPIQVVSVFDEVAEARTAVEFVRDHRDRGGRLSETAIFFRTNALSRSLERAFLDAGLPYQVVGTVAFYERREVKDLIAYLRTVVNPDDDLSLLRVMNTPPRGIGARTVEHLKAFGAGMGLRLQAVLDRLDEVPGLRPGPRRSLQAFRSFLVDLRSRSDEPVGEILAHLVTTLDFEDYLRQQGDARSDDRVDNVHELLAAANDFGDRIDGETSLVAFLEDVALVSQADLYGQEEDAVSLMTIHNAKGLEFDLVVLVAFEEGLLPHHRSLDSGERAIEEERRLCYVAITRARKELALIHAASRTSAGWTNHARMPSRFLNEFPPSLLEHQNRAFPARSTPHHDHEATSHSSGPFGTRDPGMRQTSTARSTTSSVSSSRSSSSRSSSSSSSSSEGLDVGQLVRHELFGLGRVLRLEGRGPGRKVRIHFNTAGERLLVVEYANLTLVN